jgi:hypothetical protein
MAKEPQETSGEGHHAKPIEKLRLDEPIWIAVDQADARNCTEIFNGWDAEERAKAWAGERSARLKREVGLLGPQNSVARPPENLTGEIKPVRLSGPLRPLSLPATRNPAFERRCRRRWGFSFRRCGPVRGRIRSILGDLIGVVLVFAFFLAFYIFTPA